MPINRRDFFQQAAATLAATTAAGAVVATAACAPDGSTRAHTGALDAALLAALGETVLPESLGAESRTRAVRAFADWLAGFTPVAEQMHGYGDAEITYTPSDPAPGWQAQLAGLERLATQTTGKGFAALSVDKRREVLSVPLRAVRSAHIPASPLDAPHVAIALLSHWASGSDAQDLAFGAHIGAGNCRSLNDVTRKPLPIAAAPAAAPSAAPSTKRGA